MQSGQEYCTHVDGLNKAVVSPHGKPFIISHQTPFSTRFYFTLNQFKVPHMRALPTRKNPQRTSCHMMMSQL